jgi:hypothetical protein
MSSIRRPTPLEHRSMLIAAMAKPTNTATIEDPN